MKAIYKNRNRDSIQFIDDGQGEVWMTDFFAMKLSVHGEGMDDISAVDPSGGPMIDVGDNLKGIFEDDIDRVTYEIKVGGVIKLLYRINKEI